MEFVTKNNQSGGHCCPGGAVSSDSALPPSLQSEQKLPNALIEPRCRWNEPHLTLRQLRNQNRAARPKNVIWWLSHLDVNMDQEHVLSLTFSAVYSFCLKCHD